MEILLVLVALAFPVCAIWGFVLAWGARTQIGFLAQRLAVVEARLGAAGAAPAAAPEAQAPPEPTPFWTEEPTATAPPSVEAPRPAEAPPETPSELPPDLVPDGAPVPPVPPTAQPGFEERLGTRWAVWVGGVALGLGGLFLVRYSIEQGLLGPGARIAAGAFFALALIAAGEWMRRRETASPFAAIPSAHIPGVLTAAGTSTAFATVYAAYALYGMVGPAGAFVLLGAIAVATMLASALHGPALAALGLLAALASPLLVSSAEPRLWPVVLYLAFVVFAAYGLARLRLWQWLALSAAIGALLWAWVLAAAGADMLPVMAHLLVQAALAGFFLVADPHRRTADDEANPDWPASGVLLGFAVLTVLVAASWLIGAARPPFAGAMALMLAGLAYRYVPVAPAAAGAVLVTLGTMLFWPLAREAGAEPRNLFPDVFGASPRPEAVETYLGFATGLTAVIAAASLWWIARGRTLPLATAAWYVGAATVGPLLVLIVAYWRVTGFDRSISFAVVAALLAAAFAGAAGWLRRMEEPDAAPIDGVRLALGATASAAIAALAAGLTFALDKGMLTVAFALAALGTAWVADRTALPILRYVVGAIGVVVLARLAYDPTIAGEKLGTTPLFNWLLWGYGVPALSFFLASRLLEKSGRDRVVRFVESLSIAFAAFLVFFEIRHWLQGGDPFAVTSDHLELGLMATAGLAFAIVMVRAQARRPDVVYDVASRLFGALTCVVCIAGLGGVANPLWSDEEVIGGAIFNSLMLAYLLPAILAAALAYFSWGVRPQWYVRTAGGVALALQLLYTLLEIRRIFQGPAIDASLETSQGELWTYSIALLVIGVAILAVGFLRDSRPLRLLSAGYIIAAILKVFLIDLANLQGVTRALSFIGLGLALVGIGLTYQKLLARRAGPIPAPPPA
ncbi:MAG TPA: DUF2339 domain-containing protein [Beijerinckiaceae bacterium]|nr:DUF2339 domain-containing protein [Beijerinckiaceae bacterium]